MKLVILLLLAGVAAANPLQPLPIRTVPPPLQTQPTITVPQPTITTTVPQTTVREFEVPQPPMVVTELVPKACFMVLVDI